MKRRRQQTQNLDPVTEIERLCDLVEQDRASDQDKARLLDIANEHLLYAPSWGSRITPIDRNRLVSICGSLLRSTGRGRLGSEAARPKRQAVGERTGCGCAAPTFPAPPFPAPSRSPSFPAPSWSPSTFEEEEEEEEEEGFDGSEGQGWRGYDGRDWRTERR